MTDFIRNLFAGGITPTARKARLSVESLDERLAPAALAPPASTATVVQARNEVPGTYVPGVHTPAGAEQGIVISGGHTEAGAARGIVISGG